MIRNTSAGAAPELAWFKSSYSSGAETDSCLEVATGPGTVRIRDSKVIGGPHLALAPGAWANFVAYAQTG
ncbi:DUF397 domain-containing protein [Streptomyces sp. JV176]|uniref:DUF397 domain-containing protein n=1 Tax=Streptomyces sp. JV176 TaxID=858630 RepID=UPI002E77061A|nr:DUF397 domain-containing protein [Streptomyces sp. JV176]MEE1799830.1 DUF397 domain-containing protein [Streptomyces sp. JV176]